MHSVHVNSQGPNSWIQRTLKERMGRVQIIGFFKMVPLEKVGLPRESVL